MENYYIIEIKKNTSFNNGQIIYFHLIYLLKKTEFFVR